MIFISCVFYIHATLLFYNNCIFIRPLLMDSAFKKNITFTSSITIINFLKKELPQFKNNRIYMFLSVNTDI